MSTQPEMDPMTNEAINAALENNWTRALELNKELLEKYPNNVETLNRLAKALSETGSINEAKKCYQKVLQMDPYNQIAEKNMQRLGSLKGWKVKENTSNNSVRGDLFLEEPGRTLVVSLTDTAMPTVLANLRVGDEISLIPHRNEVTVISTTGQRVGKMDSEIAKIISQDLRAGSTFSAVIKSVTLKVVKVRNSKSEVIVFVREVTRSPEVTQAPFPILHSTFTPYVREETLNLIANQAPLQTEADDGIEEVEVKELTDLEETQTQSLEDLAEKEQQENDQMDD